MSEKKYGFVVKVAVLSIIVMEYFTSMLTPVLGVMAKAFAAQGVSAELIKMVQTLPNLTMLIVAACIGLLERFMTKRQMLFTALACVFVGGLAPAFGGGIYFILACRALIGLGRGIAFPFAMSWIVELFDGQERDTLMGLRSTVGSIAGICFMQIGAILSTGGWRNAFWGYLIMIPFVFFMILKLPEPEKKEVPAAAAEQARQSKLTFNTWVIIVLNMFFMFAAYSLFTNLAIVIVDMKLGTAQLAANILSVFTIAAAITGVPYGKFIRPLFKRYSIAVGMAFVGAALTSMLFAQSLGAFYGAAVLFGIGFTIYNASLFLDVPASAGSSAAAKSLGMLMAFNGFGQFATTFVLAFLAGVFGFQGAKAGWEVAGPAILIATVLVFLMKAFNRPKEQPVATGTEA